MSFSFIKKILPRTLFARSLLILITPVLLIQMVTAVIFLDRHWGHMTTRLAYAVAGEVALVSREIENGIDFEVLRAQTLEHLGLDLTFEPGAVLPAQITSKSGFDLWRDMVHRVLEEELTRQIDRPFLTHINFAAKDVLIKIELQNGVLDVALPLRRLFSSSSYIFLLWVVGSSVLLLAVAILFMRNQIRPIRKLAVVAERFGKGLDTPSFRPSGAKEVRQAAQAFIDMRRRIKRQVEQRTTMLAGVSHDLKTPLTRLKLQLALLDDNADTKAMKDDITAMEKMIAGYLDFVRGAEGESEQAAPVNVKDALDKALSTVKHEWRLAELSCPSETTLRVRPLIFARVLGNVIDNAARYGKHIWVRVAEIDKRLEIRVEDDGPGIPEALYEEVFKPFYRVDEARNADTGGVGLGLSIVKDSIHAHGGKISLEQSPHGGLSVIMRWPL